MTTALCVDLVLKIQFIFNCLSQFGDLQNHVDGKGVYSLRF